MGCALATTPLYRIEYSMVNQNNLEIGIERWHQMNNWPSDFHNSLYRELSDLLAQDLNEINWQTIVKHLSKWKANRPKSKDFIYNNGLAKLNDFNELLNITSTIENAFWDDVETIFLLSHSIKNVNSPVFASKLSHFLFPKLFPVIDRKVIGLRFNSYRNYWEFIKQNWNESNEKEICKNILANEIGENVFENYPWQTKISEICLIGVNTV
jgi:hypothetical protein